MKNRKLLSAGVALSAILAAASPAMAGDNKAAAGNQASTQGSINSNSVNSADRDLGLDRARERANANSRLNNTARVDTSNGVTATERAFGQDRAQDRANDNANVHSEAHAEGGARAGQQ